jgi:hypothetical protein
MTELMVPVSPGELLDKITILEIKSERIDDPEKVANVARELELLSRVWSEGVTEDGTVAGVRSRLKAINEDLWEIEDEIREEEARGEFGSRFIELARAVYVTNDRRAAAKREVNLHLGSSILEEKSYKGG